MFSKYIIKQKRSLTFILTVAVIGISSLFFFSPTAVVTADSHDIPGCTDIALTALNMAVGLEESDLQYDYDQNGTVTSEDALNLLRIAVGINPVEPHVAELWQNCDENETYMASEIDQLVPICVAPALSALSMAVDLDPVDMSYDIDNNGSVTADDALNLLRMARNMQPIPKDALALFAIDCQFSPPEVTSCEAPAETALRMAVGLESVDMQYDVDNNGEVTLNDALNILRVASGYDVDDDIEARASNLLGDCTTEENQATPQAQGNDVGLIDVSRDMHGWAWSGYSDGSAIGVGWISMSCQTTNDCDGSDYGVSLQENTGELVGYAWSPNIGWIKFGGLSGFPNGGGSQAQNAQLQENGQLLGWARACAATVGGDCSSMATDANANGWDGWISLRGNGGGADGYGVRFATTQEADGSYEIATGGRPGDSYAWGGDIVMGWLDFSGVTLGGTPPPPEAPTLTATGCTIPADASSCDANIQWSAPGFTNPRIQLNRGVGDLSGVGQMGDEDVSLTGNHSTYEVRLRDGGTIALTDTVSVSCATGSSWQGGAVGSCVSDPQEKPDLEVPSSSQGNTYGNSDRDTGEYPSDEVEFFFRIYNNGATTTAYFPDNGNEPVQDVSWEFTYEDIHRGTTDTLYDSTLPIDGNGERQVQTNPGNPLTFGIYEWWGMVDQGNEIEEGDEDNNEIERFTFVLPPQDPGMDLSVSSQIVRSGDTARIEWDTNTEYAMDCALSGPGIDGDPTTPGDQPVEFNPASDKEGYEDTSPRYNTSIYTLSCQVLYYGESAIELTFTETVRVEVIPRLEEI